MDSLNEELLTKCINYKKFHHGFITELMNRAFLKMILDEILECKLNIYVDRSQFKARLYGWYAFFTLNGKSVGIEYSDVISIDDIRAEDALCFVEDATKLYNYRYRGIFNEQ